MKSCRTATERLLAHWNAPAPQRTKDLQAELQAAIDHVHHCSRCEGRLGIFVRALSADVEDPLTCTECEALLPDYVQAQQSGQGKEARWQPIATHLASCPHCVEERAELEMLVKEAFVGGEKRPLRAPAPDLSFLEPTRTGKPAAPQPWRLDELGRLLVEFTDDLLCSLLLPARRPAYALAGLKSSTPGMLFELPIQAPDADLGVTIRAEGERAASDHCTLCVQVDIPSRGGWPHLAGTEVTLKQPGHEPAQEWTDAYGEAIFDGIPVENLAGLVIEVLPGD
jgi:hypothetical protein